MIPWPIFLWIFYCFVFHPTTTYSKFHINYLSKNQENICKGSWIMEKFQWKIINALQRAAELIEVRAMVHLHLFPHTGGLIWVSQFLRFLPATSKKTIRRLYGLFFFISLRSEKNQNFFGNLFAL